MRMPCPPVGRKSYHATDCWSSKVQPAWHLRGIALGRQNGNSMNQRSSARRMQTLPFRFAATCCSLSSATLLNTSGDSCFRVPSATEVVESCGQPTSSICHGRKVTTVTSITYSFLYSLMSKNNPYTKPYTLNPKPYC